MRRTNHEQAGESAFELFQRVAEAGGLESREMLACAAAEIGTAGAQFVRTGRGRRRADEDHLFRTGSVHLSSRRPSAPGLSHSAMRLPAPRTLRPRTSPGAASSPPGSRARPRARRVRDRARRRPDRMSRATRAALPAAPGRPKNRGRWRVTQQREHHLASRVRGRARSPAVHGSPAARDSPRAVPRIAAPDPSLGGATIGAAPRIRFQSSASAPTEEAATMTSGRRRSATSTTVVCAGSHGRGSRTSTPTARARPRRRRARTARVAG